MLEKNIKQKVLETIKSKEWYNFKDLLNANKRKRLDFEETLGELSRCLQTDLWNALYAFSVKIDHGKPFSEEDGALELMDVDEDGEQLRKEQAQTSFRVVIVITQIQLNLLKSKMAFIPQGLIDFIVYLGSILGDLEDSICKQAVDICEEWIHKEFPKFEAIQMNTMIVMVGLSLDTKAKKQTVKRVWGIRRVLPNIIANCKSDNVDDPIKSLLISCASSTIYLSCEEGIKFLAELLSVPQFMDDIHKIVKKSLPSCSRGQSAAYSEAYLRAWKAAPAEVKTALEENCFQDLMYAAVHVDPNINLANNLKSFLQYIHSHKKHVPTAVMIYKLYEPFIWRSLKAANGYVRLNVTVLLCDAFPLTNAGTNEEEETLLEQQYKAVLELLVDPCHLVRIAAIKGTFHILSHYWRLLPSHVIQQIFQIYIGKLLRDASNTDGRVQIIYGFTQLLDCAEAFTFLSNVLPRVSASCDDVNPSVRVAFIKLLLRLKSTRHIRYWKLTSMEHLLHLLDDDPQTRPYIVKLIQNSFVPVNLNEKEWLQRTISFVTSNRGAARRFYQLSSKQIDLESTTRFMLYIWRTVFRYVKLSLDHNDSSLSNINETVKESEPLSENVRNPRKKLTTAGKGSNKENIDQGEVQYGLALDNTEVTAGLIDIIVIMWTINTDRFSKPENLKYIVGLRTRIAKCFPVIWSFFKESEIANSLLYLASLLPPSFTPTMSGFCMSKLKQVSDHKNSDDMTNLYLTALCNWNRLDDILQLTTDWLTKVFDSLESSINACDSKKWKKVCFQETPPKPLVGLSFLKSLLRHRLNRLCLLHKNRHLVCDLCHLMSRVKDVMVRRVAVGERLSPSCTDEVILTCYEDYLTLVILLHKTDPNASENVDTRDVLEVFAEHLTVIEKMFNDHSPEGDSFEICCVVCFIQSATSLLATGAANVDFIQNLIDFVEEVFKKCMECDRLYNEVFLLLNEIGKYLNSYCCNTEEIVESSLLLNFLKRILKDNILSGSFSARSHETRNAVLEGTVNIIQQLHVHPERLQIIMELLTLFVLEKVIDKFQNDEFKDEVENFMADEMYFKLLKRVFSKPKLLSAFYSVLLDAIMGVQFNVQKIFAMLYILNELVNSDKCNNKKTLLLEETKLLLSRIETHSEDSNCSADFIGSCLKRSEELIENLQNIE